MNRPSTLIGLLSVLAPAWVGATSFDGDDRPRAVTIRGGVGTFTGDLNERTAAGPVWGASFRLDPSRPFGLELSYDGSMNDLEDARLLSPARVQRHGVSALFKLGYPVTDTLRPYAGVGLGASLVSPSQVATPLYRSDLMEEIPLSAGIDFAWRRVTAGVRTTYRMLLDEDFADSASPDGNAQGGMLDATVNLGGRF
jgi:opacity protein-like surface antigen